MRGTFESASLPRLRLQISSLPTCLLLLGSVASCGGKGASSVDGNAGFAAQAANPRGESDAAAAPSLAQRQFDAAALEASARPDGVDTTGGAWRIIAVPGLSAPAIVRSPSGWLALSRRIAGGKAISGAQTALYRSTDGVHWTAIPLAQDNTLAMRWLVYGAGRYLMSGNRFGLASGDVIWTSSDGERWHEASAPSADVAYWADLAYVENRFFRFGFNSLGISETGEGWRVAPLGIVQGGAAAYGNGLYLLSGNGPMQTSEDGWTWREHPVDCALPAACITDPSGRVGQSYHDAPIFAEGRFYSGQLSSADGVSWRVEPRPAVAAYVSGHFLGHPSVVGGFAAWVTGGETQTLRVIDPSREAASNPGRPAGYHELELGQLPDQVSVEFEDGLTCETAACVSVGGSLLLVPPPGTAPLVDRVPRGADGAPLLTRDCPVSSMVFCDDYAAREHCVCNPDAPRGPDHCEDVGRYRCAGRFSASGGEWPLDELGPGGCDCDGVDPNQPAGFGTTCDGASDACLAPLECLPIDPPASEGPPDFRSICTSACTVDADCPSWHATGFCAGPVNLRCSNGSCQPRRCD